jgi:arginase
VGGGAARRAGELPVILSGSCFAAVGIVAGLDEHDPAVIWFDAHGDFNEPATSESGYFDGMGVAILTGGAWQRLLDTVPGARPLPESSVVLAGARDLDDAEVRRLAESEIVRLPTETLREPGALTAAVRALEPPPSGVYLHLDLDVLDLAEARVNRYSAPGGLTATELEGLARAAVGELDVRAISLTAYEPELDPDALVPPIAIRVLSAIAAEATA